MLLSRHSASDSFVGCDKRATASAGTPIGAVSFRRSSGALDLRVIANLGLKPEAIVTRQLRSQSHIGAPAIRCGAAAFFGERVMSHERSRSRRRWEKIRHDLNGVFKISARIYVAPPELEVRGESPTSG